MSNDETNMLMQRLERIEATLSQLVQQKVAKEWYTTAEVAEIVGRSEPSKNIPI